MRSGLRAPPETIRGGIGRVGVQTIDREATEKNLSNGDIYHPRYLSGLNRAPL